MTMPTTQFQVMNARAQNPLPVNHLHTPRSIFEHMMAQQNIPHEPGSWAQMPQVPPMYMPWSVPSPQQPHLMRFTGEKPPVCGSALHQKRKIEIPEVPRPTKQFISEEKMAAHFRDMHISTTHSPTPCSSSTTNYSVLPQPSTSSQIDINVDSGALENGKSIHPKLVISEELKRFQTEPLLPASLLSKLERPSMALMLWEPPSKHLRIFNTQNQPQAQTSTTSTSNGNVNNNRMGNNNNNDNNNNDNNDENIVNNNNYISNNNNNQMPDLNRIAALESNDVEFEPMDV